MAWRWHGLRERDIGTQTGENQARGVRERAVLWVIPHRLTEPLALAST